MPDLHHFPVYSLVDEGSVSKLQTLLKNEAWLVRHLSSVGARDRASFLLGAAESMRFPVPRSWSALSDLLSAAIVPAVPAAPVEQVPSRTALMWWGAGELAAASLGTMLRAFDVIVGIAREAYESDVDMAVFLVGSGPGFLPFAAVTNTGYSYDDAGDSDHRHEGAGGSRNGDAGPGGDDVGGPSREGAVRSRDRAGRS